MKNKFTTLWESPVRNHNNDPFMTAKSWNNKYYFSERAGKDSVAFILHDHRTNLYACIREFKPPIDQFLVTAFGGSMDNPSAQPLDIVITECKEEAGFNVQPEDVKYCGTVMVSTQSNQMCHLYLVHVDARSQGETDPQCEMEATATVHWLTQDEVFRLNDWKAPTIIVKSYL